MRSIAAAFWFSLHSAGQNFRRNLGVSLAGVFTMGLILFIAGAAVLVVHTVQNALQQQEARADTIKIYIQDGASQAQIADFQWRLAHDSRVISVGFENKDAAVNDKNNGFDYKSAIAALGSNPLPASLNVTVHQLAQVKQINDLAMATPIHDGTTPTNYNQDVTGKLQALILGVGIVGLVFSLIMLMVSVVLIMNTIRTAVFARRTEIEIMKLVGATDWFVRWPFVLEGLIGGLLAAVFSVVVINTMYQIGTAMTKGQFFSFPYDGGFVLFLALCLLGGGIIVGGFGSYLGVRRHLTV